MALVAIGNTHSHLLFFVLVVQNKSYLFVIRQLTHPQSLSDTYSVLQRWYPLLPVE